MPRPDEICRALDSLPPPTPSPIFPPILSVFNSMELKQLFKGGPNNNGLSGGLPAVGGEASAAEGSDAPAPARAAPPLRPLLAGVYDAEGASINSDEMNVLLQAGSSPLLFYLFIYFFR